MFPYWTSTVKPDLLQVIKPVYLDKEDHFAADLKAALKIEELIANRMVCSVLVDKKFSNIHGTLHGGAYAYLADLVSSMNIMTSNAGFRASVSLELNASYLKPALMNKQLFIASQILKTGKQTAVAEIKFYDEKGEVLCACKHTKFFLPSAKL